MEEILNGNKLIAEFMGKKIVYDEMAPFVQLSEYTTIPLHEWAQYHSSWDWIQPVVDKASLVSEDIYEEEKKLKVELWMYLTNNINEVFLAVVKFIENNKINIKTK